ncbi:hypothetical protein PsYK624_098910 [Phanerochaete sordida]|uniref:F-box domain-containing protein n=1 Tax=Phanerochaete sordida TaxID=48140 RepID=A0A9P3LFX8_9APHY|nr:hypothetical protein PsYK624_098910 [Phanerochaete sordida]
MMQSYSEPTSIDSFKLLQTDLVASSVLLDRVCAHLDMASLTSLLVKNLLPHWRSTAGDPASPALHRFLERCSALRSLTCHSGVFDGLFTYPHLCPTLHELRFVDTVYRQPFSAPWTSVGHIMDCPIAAAVCTVALDLTLCYTLAVDEPAPDARGLEEAFRRVVEGWHWPSLTTIVGRLQSLAVNVELRLLQSVLVNTAHSIKISVALPRAWTGDPEVYHAILWSTVHERLSIAAHQRLDVHITFPPAAMT